MPEDQLNPSEEQNSQLETGDSKLEAQPAPVPEPQQDSAEPSSAEPFRLESPPPPTPEEPKKPTPKKDPEEASQSPFTVTVGQVYDGPFDLLLDLIRKQNIDIYDIPIAR